MSVKLKEFLKSPSKKKTKLLCLVQLDTSRKASNQGEKTEDADEEKLEAVGIQSEGILRNFDVLTDQTFICTVLGSTGQEGGDGTALLTFEFSKTVIVGIDLLLPGLGPGLGGLLVVEVRDGGGVDSRVDEDRLDDLSGASTTDLTKTELRRSISERWVSLALCYDGLWVLI